MKAAAYNEGVGGGFVCLLLKVPSASVSEYTASILICNLYLEWSFSRHLRRSGAAMMHCINVCTDHGSFYTVWLCVTL